MTAVSQYFDDRRSRWSDDPSGALDAATKCFLPLRAILESLGISHCIFDLGFCVDSSGEVDQLVVIEINSFGMRTGSALFDWDNPVDLDILSGAADRDVQPAVRVVTDARHPRGDMSVLARTQKFCLCEA